MDAIRAHGRPVIAVTSEASELEQLFSFRYRIYVEEMQRPQKYADHVSKRIRDPLDDCATNIVARDSAGVIIGTVRTNFSRHGDLLGYDSFYAMDTADSAHPGETSICTRLMIAPEYRRSMLAVRLSIFVYEYGLNNGIAYNFIDCNEHLIRFFTGLGFTQHIPTKNHEEYGDVTCMRLHLHDRDHLQRLSSPFVASLNRWQLQASTSSELEASPSIVALT